jgi:hypothetical protein
MNRKHRGQLIGLSNLATDEKRPDREREPEPWMNPVGFLVGE